MDTKVGVQWNKNWVNCGPTEWGGAGLDTNIVDINENYINYINYNPKLVEETDVDELAVADTGITGNYMTLDAPCDNNKISVSPLPIRMPNREIITSTHTVLISKTNLPIEAWNVHIFPGLNKALLSIVTFCNHGCQAVSIDKKLLILNKGNGEIMIKDRWDTFSNIYMLNLTHRNNLMTEFQNADIFFRGMCMSENQKSHLWITTTHHAGAPINMGG